MLGTIVATGYLYVVIPKGFFPEQDTGLLQGITEAATDISFPAMVQRQQAIVDTVMKDPAVESGTHYIGPGGPHPPLNPGHRALSASGAGHNHRWPGLQDAVSIYPDRRRFDRAQPLDGNLPR